MPNEEFTLSGMVAAARGGREFFYHQCRPPPASATLPGRSALFLYLQNFAFGIFVRLEKMAGEFFLPPFGKSNYHRF